MEIFGAPTFVTRSLPCLVSRVSDPDPVFLHGSGSGFQISLDPDPNPVFKLSGSGPGSGFSQDYGKLQKGL